MNNGTKSLSINETFIIEPVDGVEVYSACTAFYTNNLISCSGNTEIIMGIGGVSTNLAFSAVTFYGDGSNLTGISTQDTYITGGTYSAGTTRLFDSSGNTITIGGYFTPSDDIYVSGLTFNTSNYDLTVKRNDGVNFTQSLSILASDLTITGGTYNPSTGTATFTNNTGGTFNVTGFLTGFTDIFVTGATFNNDNLRLTRNDNNNINVAINKFDSLTANTISATTYENLPIKYYAEFSGSPSIRPIVYSANSIAIGDGAEALNENMFVVGQYAGSGTTANNSNFIGYEAGFDSTEAESSNFFGYQAGYNATTVSDSNFFGYVAGNSATNASNSNFFGNGAGREATDASNCNFLGNSAGFSATTVSGSNFIGNSAGYQTIEANYSNFFGYAGALATDVNNSNFFGNQAGVYATDASNSNFIGENAGFYATNANDSNFLGQETGREATNATFSNFFGYRAGYKTINSSSSNFIGYLAGSQVTGASYSTLIGFNVGSATGASLSIGSNNIIIGTNISLPTGTQDSINIGGVLFGSNTYFNSNGSTNPFTGALSTGRIGINVVQPTHSLHVSGDTRIQGGLTATTYNGYNPLPTQAAISSGVTLSFITDTVYGTLLTPETSSAITANVTGALLGVTNILIHSGSTTPTFESQYKKLSGSGNYSAGTINYIFCTYIAPTEIIYSINQR
jgi:hypothetical protein